MSNELLAIIGGCITLGLGINAWFFKALWSEVHQVRILTTIWTTRSENTEKRIDRLEKRIEDLEHA
jgi:hypothetical protein